VPKSEVLGYIGPDGVLVCFEVIARMNEQYHCERKFQLKTYISITRVIVDQQYESSFVFIR